MDLTSKLRACVTSALSPVVNARPGSLHSVSGLTKGCKRMQCLCQCLRGFSVSVYAKPTWCSLIVSMMLSITADVCLWMYSGSKWSNICLRSATNASGSC